MATRSELMEQVMREMERVWGPDGLDGNFEEYEWLERHYGITYEEDCQWIDIILHSVDDLDAQGPFTDEEREELLRFLEDEAKICSFLEKFLKKYRSDTAIYQRNENSEKRGTASVIFSIDSFQFPILDKPSELGLSPQVNVNTSVSG